MSEHDLDWLRSQRPDTVARDPGAHDRALLSLLQHTSSARSQSSRRRRGAQSAGGSSGSRLSHIFRRVDRLAGAAVLGVTAAAAAIVAVVVVGGSHGVSGGVHGITTHRSAPILRITTAHIPTHTSGSPLMRLASDVIASQNPPGDATLVARTTGTGTQSITVYDLYTDAGPYYFSQIEAGLPAQVAAHNNQGGGLFAREVAAAKLGATGNVSTAAQDMADAPDPRHVISPGTIGNGPFKDASLYDNWVWEDAQDALIAGAGQPDVRAGVLRILATLPDVTVAQTTTDGNPTLTLTYSVPGMTSAQTHGKPAFGPYQEQDVIDAETGVPIKVTTGTPGQTTGAQVTYKVTRVTLSNLASVTGSN